MAFDLDLGQQEGTSNLEAQQSESSIATLFCCCGRKKYLAQTMGDKSACWPGGSEIMWSRGLGRQIRNQRPQIP